MRNVPFYLPFSQVLRLLRRVTISTSTSYYEGAEMTQLDGQQLQNQPDVSFEGRIVLSAGTKILTPLIFLIVIFSYFPILNAPITADDYYWFSPAIVQNPWQYFVRDMLPDDPDADFLRPLPFLTFALENHWRGAFPILPHCTNLFFHLATMILVGKLISWCTKKDQIKGGALAPLAGMLLFGLHPQATGAVCWISARPDIMSGFFGAAGIYIWRISSERGPFSGWRWAAVLTLILSLLSKEVGITFPAAIFLWELGRWIRHHGSLAIIPRVISLAQPLVLIGAFFLWRWLIFRGVGGYSNYGMSHLNWRMPIGYLAVVLWPFSNPGPVPSLGFCLVLVSLTILIIIGLSRNKRHNPTQTRLPWFLPLLIWIIPPLMFLPSQGFLSIRDVLFHAEARLSYVSIIGFAILAGWLFRILQSLRFGRLIASISLATFLCFCVWAQQTENLRWIKASHLADSIVEQTMKLIPEPKTNAILIFSKVPLCLDRWYYVFGIGLPEAIQYHYQRADLQVVRFPSPEMIANPPQNSFVLKFDYPSSSMILVNHK